MYNLDCAPSFGGSALNRVLVWSLFVVTLAFVPPLCLGILRKTKARLQNRIGSPIWQPFLDLTKLFQKDETLSGTMCGVFRISTVVGLSSALTLSWLIPWVAIKPWSHQADIFVVIYVLALAKMFTMLGAMDAGSPFGAFGASREATLNFLVEPAICLALIALAITCNSTDLTVIFASTPGAGMSVVWLLVGVAVFLASLVELSRMPVDDPTTHLELTMVHEAMILEASAKNLFLLELTQVLKMAMFWGLSAQCFLHTIPAYARCNLLEKELCSVAGIFLLAFLVGVLEGLIVKLQWRKIPEFVAYIMTVSLIAVFVAVSGKSIL
ncbi:MAG: hypothetical protein EKK48_22585 [Candidatus Melainabacteria bacterium]|nr:MAG: hypothetical protein EKK48_22585 [Candidatus Melainabacteria bacterium]